MNNIVLKNSIFIILAISSILWIILAWISDLDLSKAKDFISLVPKVATIDLFLISLFVKWGWKLPLFQNWLVPFPNLNGTWTGTIHSDWKNTETNESVPPIPVMLTIKQSYFRINCSMHTEEMKSHSYNEGFNIDKDTQIKQLIYVYTSRPRVSVSTRSQIHDGAIVFEIIERPERKLKGRYWTERKTCGEIFLNLHTNELMEEMPQSMNSHPLTNKTN